jgi:hypothetical protein
VVATSTATIELTVAAIHTVEGVEEALREEVEVAAVALIEIEDAIVHIDYSRASYVYRWFFHCSRLFSILAQEEPAFSVCKRTTSPFSIGTFRKTLLFSIQVEL